MTKNNFCIWMLRIVIFFFRFKNEFLAEAQQFKINICSNKTTWNKSCLIWNNAYTIHMKWSSNIMKKKKIKRLSTLKIMILFILKNIQLTCQRKTLECIIVWAAWQNLKNRWMKTRMELCYLRKHRKQTGPPYGTFWQQLQIIKSYQKL